MMSFFLSEFEVTNYVNGGKKPWLSDRCLMKCRLYMLLKEMIQDAEKGYSDSLTISNEM